MRKLFVLLIAISIPQFAFSQTVEGFNCYSILVGKDCSVDGSVLFAHNEDDSGDQIVNMYRVPELKHKSDAVVVLKNGATLPQIPYP